MERKTSMGIEYENKELGIEGVYPLNFSFFPEGKERPAQRNGVEGLIIGYAKPHYSGGPDGQVLFVESGSNNVEGVHKSTVIYEHKPFKIESTVDEELNADKIYGPWA